MKVLKHMFLLTLSMLGVGFASAQTIRVYKVDGMILDFPYSEVDSLVAYGYQGGDFGEYEAVDLGLSVKWATCNVGAATPSEYGDYFAWGEVSPKSEYTSANSFTFGITMGDIAGDSHYDAARANWGGSWRLPTKAECEELVNCCTWIWTTQNGNKGYKVMGLNGRSIFLPAAGWRNGTSLDRAGEYGYYWSSTPHESNTWYAYDLYFYGGNRGVSRPFRDGGRSVRPVSE